MLKMAFKRDVKKVHISGNYQWSVSLGKVVLRLEGENNIHINGL